MPPAPPTTVTRASDWRVEEMLRRATDLAAVRATLRASMFVGRGTRRRRVQQSTKTKTKNGRRAQGHRNAQSRTKRTKKTRKDRESKTKKKRDKKRSRQTDSTKHASKQTSKQPTLSITRAQTDGAIPTRSNQADERGHARIREAALEPVRHKCVRLRVRVNTERE